MPADAATSVGDVDADHSQDLAVAAPSDVVANAAWAGSSALGCSADEPLADTLLADMLLAEFAIAKLRITMTKPGAVPEAEGVGVAISREKPLAVYR